jgi:serine/threonine protein kinase
MDKIVGFDIFVFNHCYSTRDVILCTVLQFCGGGSLFDRLHNCKNNNSNNKFNESVIDSINTTNVNNSKKINDNNNNNKQYGPLSMPQIMSVARDIVNGMSYLHAQGRIHRFARVSTVKPQNLRFENRDLKTPNVLLSDTGNAIVSDFGLSRENVTGAVTMTIIGVLCVLLCFVLWD